MNRNKIMTFFVILALAAMIVPSVIGFFNDISSAGSNGGITPTVTPPTNPTTNPNSEPVVAVKPIADRDNNNPTSEVPEQPFVHEGELSFKSKDGKEIQKIEIEIADNEEQTRQGLMFRRQMLSSRGMLFLFPEEKQQAFWMHNTYIPLDIIYVNNKKEIVSIQKNAKILNDNPLPSNAPASLVVEVVGSFCDKHNIKVGDKIDFKRD